MEIRNRTYHWCKHHMTWTMLKPTNFKLKSYTRVSVSITTWSSSCNGSDKNSFTQLSAKFSQHQHHIDQLSWSTQRTFQSSLMAITSMTPLVAPIHHYHNNMSTHGQNNEPSTSHLSPLVSISKPPSHPLLDHVHLVQANILNHNILPFELFGMRNHIDVPVFHPFKIKCW